MSTVTVEALADAIASLSLEEARALLAGLRARLELEDEAWSFASMGAVYGAPTIPFDDARDAPHAVVLEAVGPRPVEVMATLRAHLPRSLREVRDALDAAPTALGPLEDRAAAERFAASLSEVGATVRVVRA